VDGSSRAGVATAIAGRDPSSRVGGLVLLVVGQRAVGSRPGGLLLQVDQRAARVDDAHAER
jgi:hypothetical protein